jgi:hypothetical protein
MSLDIQVLYILCQCLNTVVVECNRHYYDEAIRLRNHVEGGLNPGNTCRGGG